MSKCAAKYRLPAAPISALSVADMACNDLIQFASAAGSSGEHLRPAAASSTILAPSPGRAAIIGSPAAKYACSLLGIVCVLVLQCDKQASGSTVHGRHGRYRKTPNQHQVVESEIQFALR